VPLAADARFSYPRRIDGRPDEAQPSAAHLALLLALFEDDVSAVVCRHGLASYRSVLDSPFVQIPHEAIVPGVLQAGDLTGLAAALAPRQLTFESLVDGRGRLVPPETSKEIYAPAIKAYANVKDADIDFTEAAQGD
jgi:hypothetical protein